MIDCFFLFFTDYQPFPCYLRPQNIFKLLKHFGETDYRLILILLINLELVEWVSRVCLRVIEFNERNWN